MEKEKEKAFVTEWTDKIKSGITYREKYSTYSKWKSFRDMYRNQWDNKVLPVNKIYSYGRMLVPRVYFGAPRVCVTATHPAFVIHARVVEAIDNMLIRELFLKRTLKKSILDTYLCGVGPIKLGFDSEFGYIPDQAIDADGETVTQVSQKTGDKIEYSEMVKPGLPWALRCRPEDIIVPWGSEDFKNVPWIAHRITRTLEDVQQDQKYNKAVTKELKGTRVRADNAGGASFKPITARDKDNTFVELWEVRDTRTHKIYVFCEEHLLLDVDDPLQVEGLPYEFIDFNPDPEFVWSIPDADILQAQQTELNDISTQAKKHRAIALLKFIYDKAGISQTELEKFLSDEVGPAIGVDGGGNLAGVIMTLQPHIPPDFQMATQAITAAMQESLGFNKNELSDYQSGSPRSATETMTVSNSFEQRLSERKDIVSDVLVNIIRKWNQFIFKFWTSERVVRIVGPEGAESWISYTGDQLEGEYFLNVDPDSGMPLTKGMKYQMAQDLLAKFGGDPMIDQIMLRQIALESYSSIDPRATQLLNVPPMLDPALVAAARQPSPMGAGAGGGKGAGGGRSGSSPERPQEFDSFKKRFNLGNK